MAGNAKKLTYGSSPILVDYASKDAQGNDITTEYLHAKDLSINSVEDATAILKTLTLGGVTYSVNSQDTKDFEVINLTDIVPSFNPSGDYNDENPLIITIDAETFNKLYRENIILKAPSGLTAEVSFFYIPSAKSSTMNTISFRLVQFAQGSDYYDFYLETIVIGETGGTYALSYAMVKGTTESKYTMSVDGDTLTITENY